jgi:hypothetical protein
LSSSRKSCGYSRTTFSIGWVLAAKPPFDHQKVWVGPAATKSLPRSRSVVIR